MTFFNNFSSGATTCHGVPRKLFQVRYIPCITQCLSRPTFALHTSVLGNTQHCSCSITTANKDSLSHTTRKGTGAISSNFPEPDFFLSKLCHWVSPSSSSSPHFARPSSESSTMSFHFFHRHFHTTVGRVISLWWSLRNHCNTHTRLNYCILK